MINYFETTWDTELLAEKIYPFMKKAARTYEVWLDEEEDGSFTMYAGYNEGSWAKNPAKELGPLKNVLSKLI
ncbi:MAG: hypothetical protein FWE80_04685, partial [Oscillospiraceae bacterium]|nr:hypothetical protein [Oscillospiraceae bacterium]